MLKLYSFLLTIGVLLMLFSCKENDDIDVDIPRRLFRPSIFQHVLNVTDVSFQWTPIKNADYLLEVSPDPEFFSDVMSFTVSNTNELTVENLWSSTGYNARLKAISKNPEIGDSKFISIKFTTGVENVFFTQQDGSVGVDFVELSWNFQKEVTHIIVSIDGNEEGGSKRVDLTETNKSEGKIKIDGLLPDTKYVFKIFKTLQERGTQIVTTLPNP
jgi:hypothetical protein